MFILTNAFSLNMLSTDSAQLFVQKVSLEEAKLLLAKKVWISAVGHEDTANILAGMLGVIIPFNRINIKLEKQTQLLIAQYSGPRLPEGAQKLPEGSKIEFFSIVIEDEDGKKGIEDKLNRIVSLIDNPHWENGRRERIRELAKEGLKLC